MYFAPNKIMSIIMLLTILVISLLLSFYTEGMEGITLGDHKAVKAFMDDRSAAIAASSSSK
jgi:hypothetical protein